MCEWRPCPGYIDSHEVSDDGQVRRSGLPVTSKRYGRTLAHQVTGHGCRQVYLTRHGVTQGHQVSRLVCEAFHGPSPTPDHLALHIDGDRGNCRADNLRWGTHAEAMEKRERLGNTSRGSAHSEVITRREMNIGQVIAARRRVRAGESVASVAADYGVTRVALGLAVYGHAWRHVDAMEPPVTAARPPRESTERSPQP